MIHESKVQTAFSDIFANSQILLRLVLSSGDGRENDCFQARIPGGSHDAKISEREREREREL